MQELTEFYYHLLMNNFEGSLIFFTIFTLFMGAAFRDAFVTLKMACKVSREGSN